MSACCSAVLSDKFNAQLAALDAERYRKSGPDGTTKRIINGLARLGMRGELIDVGAGIGVVGIELLSSGVATRVTAVEASPSYIDTGRGEADALGIASDLTYVAGDFATGEPAVTAAEFVTLDRVVCCYPDYRELLVQSAAHTQGALAISYPRDAWYIRAFMSARNMIRGWNGQQFQFHVHPVRAMAQVLEGAGLRRVSRAKMFVWQVDVYVRDDGSPLRCSSSS